MTTIYVIYHSQQYGNTQLMAEAVVKGAEQAGAECNLVNTYAEAPDMERVRTADALAIGSPDYFGYVAGTLKVFMDTWFFGKRDNPEGMTAKPYALFYSHGGGGRVKESMERLFSALRGPKIGETVESRGTPTDTVLAECYALGKLLAESL